MHKPYYAFDQIGKMSKTKDSDFGTDRHHRHHLFFHAVFHIVATGRGEERSSCGSGSGRVGQEETKRAQQDCQE